jgi:hypothetical protein
MPVTWFQFANPHTGTLAGTGAGASRADASGDWSLLLNRMDDDANVANIIMINEDAYITHDGGVLAANSAHRRFWGGRPNAGTHFRTWSTGRAAARGYTHVTFDCMNYTAQDAFTGSPTWQYVAEGVWSLTVGTFAAAGRVRSVWACSGEVRGQYSGVTRFELCRRASSSACTNYGDWFSPDLPTATTQTIFVNSGAALNPDQAFGGLCFQWIDSARNWAVQFLSQQRMTMDNWMVLGGGLTFSSSGGITCEDLTFNNLRLELQSGNVGLNIVLDDVPDAYTTPMRRLRFNELTVKRNQENSLAKRVDNEFVVGLDHVIITGYVSDVVFRNPTVDSRMVHTGIAVYAFTGENNIPAQTATNDWPRNIEVYGTFPGGARFLGPRGNGASQCYGRPFQANTNGQVTFRNFIAQDWNTAVQLSGRVKLENGWIESPTVDYDGYDDPGNDNKVSPLLVVGLSALGSVVTPTDIEVNNVALKTHLQSRFCVGLGQNPTAVNDYTKAVFNHCTFIDTYQGAQKKYQQSDGSPTLGPPAAIRLLRWNTTGLAATHPVFRDSAFVQKDNAALGTATWDVPTPGAFGFTTVGPDGLLTANTDSRDNVVFPSEVAAGITSLTSISATSPLAGRTMAGEASTDINGVIRGAPNALGAAEPV